MKKFMVFLLAVMVLISAAAASAQEPANMADLKAIDASLTEDIHIEIWGKDGTSNENSRGTIFTNFADEYSAMFDHVTVEYIHQGGYDDVRTKVMAASVAGDLPGIWMAEESTVKSFAAIAADLNECVPEATVKDYLPGLLSASLYDGDRLIGAPAARSNPVMFVNNEVLSAAGWTGDMIKTTDDLFQCAKDIYEKTGKAGLAAWWDSDLWHWESEIYADGGQVLSDDGTHPTFGKDYDYVGAKYALRIQEGLKEGYVVSYYTDPKPYDSVTLNLTSGELGIALISSNSMKSRYTAAAENGYTLNVYVQPVGEAGVPSVTGGGSCWVLADSMSDVEKAFAGGWLSYIASVDKIVERTRRNGDMMVTQSALDSEGGKALIEEVPGLQAIYDSVPYLHARPNTPYWAEMYSYGADKLAQFCLNYETTDVYALVDDMELKFQQIIDDNAW